MSPLLNVHKSHEAVEGCIGINILCHVSQKKRMQCMLMSILPTIRTAWWEEIDYIRTRLCLFASFSNLTIRDPNA